MEIQNKKEEEKTLSESGQLAVVKKAVENALHGTRLSIFFKDVQYKDSIKINKDGTNIGVMVNQEEESLKWELCCRSSQGIVIGSTGSASELKEQASAIVDVKRLIEENYSSEFHELESQEGIAKAWVYETEGLTNLLIRNQTDIIWKEKNYLSRCKKLIAAIYNTREGCIKLTGIEEISQYKNVSNVESVIISFNRQKLNYISQMQILDEKGICLVELKGISFAESTDSVKVGNREDAEDSYVLEVLKMTVGEVTGISFADIEDDVNLVDYGFDSISIVEFAEAMNHAFNITVTPDVIFTYSTIGRLSEYLQENFELKSATSGRNEEYIFQNAGDVDQKEPKVQALEDTGGIKAGGMDSEIGIIGMSGRFPNARNIEELWNILCGNRNVVKQVPSERKEWCDAYGSLNSEKEKNRKLGVIPGIAEFDPLFFEIAPVEAEKMDPRQRLLLQEMWKALEDAGYHSRNLAEEKVGIFVGAEDSEYKQISGRKSEEITSNSSAVMAARLAYFLNLEGPNMAINTACSSGLVALHEACLNIRNNECTMAIVAAANLLITPDSYYMMEMSGMLSKTGTCSTFDNKADGMVPAEAVAVVVLKKAEKAQEDHNRIYASILGDGVNYDGKTNGITAPGGYAQEKLILDVMNRFHIKAEDITCVVAHGTGTRLGDPIEVNALNSAYKQLTDKRNYCALISVKPNLGHAMAASGLVSLIGAVLSMRKQTIPSTINCSEPNNYIHWEESPFYLNTQNRIWKLKNGKRPMASISALGFSGTNAHIVIKSYLSEQEEAAAVEQQHTKPCYLLAFSGKTKEALETKISEFKEYAKEHPVTERELVSISYTLLCLREHFAYRAVFIVKEVGDVFRLGTDQEQNVKKGKVERRFKPENEVARRIQNDIGLACDSLDVEEYKKFMESMAQSYCEGYDEAVSHLWDKENIIMKSIGFYPFDKGNYWISEDDSSDKKTNSDVHKLHPMVHYNVSDFTEQRYISDFMGKEFFLTEHRINEIPVLPGVAYLEMAYKAALESIGVKDEKDASGIAVSLKEVGWFSPVSIAGDEVRVNTELKLEEHNTISYRVFTQDREKHVHSQGFVEFTENEQIPKTGLDELLRKPRKKQNIVELYDRFRENGLVYGREFSCVKELYSGEGVVIARLIAGENKENKRLALKPGILDGAFQSTALFEMLNGRKNERKIPFSVESVTVYKVCENTMWSVAREHEEKGSMVSYDLDLYDEQGNLCVKVRGFTSRVLADGELERGETILLKPVWKESSIADGSNYKTDVRHIVVLCQMSEEEAGFHQIVLEEKKPYRVYSLLSDDQKYEEYALGLFKIIKSVFENKFAGQIFLQVVYKESLKSECIGGLIGLLQSASRENPRMVVQLVSFEEETIIAENLIKEIKPEADAGVRYRQGKRFICTYERVRENAQNPEILWKENGVYLITGGAGGLGLIFAGEILKRCESCTVLLTGRSKNENITNRLQMLKCTKQQKVEYIRLDVSNLEEIEKAVQYAMKQYGGLDGIIHAAGIIRDNLIIKKEEEEFLSVLLPKVAGVQNLDAATRQCPLDFMIYFSSTSGVFGNAGQSDYAAANGFMDAFAAERNERRQRGECFGKTFSIDWFLWKHGGMSMGQAKEELLVRRSGISPLETEQGLDAFYRIISAESSQAEVLSGDFEKIERTLLVSSVLEQKMDTKKSDILTENTEINVITLLKDILSESLKIPRNRIDADAPMEEYGIDSILTMDMTGALEERFGMLPKTLFFEYQTIRELAGYFMNAHADKLRGILTNTEDGEISEPAKHAEARKSILDFQIKRTFQEYNCGSSAKSTSNEDVAIIGIAGKYPKAEDVEIFWNNISQGVDSIEEIPQTRWDYRKYYNPDKTKNGSSYSKWGGFINGVDEFDPLIFGISPREAVMMDPQERLFLMCVYKAVEDAGYTKENIVDNERSAGVFTGVMYEDYQLYAANEQTKGHMITANGSEASIANRISYYFNFNGPSIAMDTMCSSSLTSVHLACQSLKNKECRVAVAGGVNVTVHPNKHLLLSSGKYAASDGRCRSFGEGGDGYVPGEGVGAVILKPLKEAEKAKDHIYGVIKATAINHGGKTNGYTVPNPNAQASLIRSALKKSDIDAGTISYIEAHGTGTSLGDPVEITGLTKAFEEYTSDRQFCYIGSVKSNIGHCESAAGIAGITKVLMQLKYKKIAPSLHSETLNPYIDFAKTPFQVPQTLIDWERPQIKENGRTVTCPRRAGISAFGAGGANAHIIIEEYEETVKGKARENTTKAAVLLSARSADQLETMQKNLRNYLIAQKYTDKDLLSIAYTLQRGREHMLHRMGFIVENMEQLLMKLDQSFQNLINDKNIYYKNLEDVERYSRQVSDETSCCIAQKDYDGLLSRWVQGEHINWEKLYDENTRPYKISLPTYEFEKERYWLSVTKDTQVSKMVQDTDTSQTDASSAHVHISDGQDVREMLEEDLKGMVSQILQIPIEKISIHNPVEDFGFESISLVEFVEEINNKLGLEITPDLLFSYPTIKELSEHLENEYESVRKHYFVEDKQESESPAPLKQEVTDTVYVNENKNTKIAVIGMSGRFPEARNVEEFWNILKNKKEVISEVHREGFIYEPDEEPMKMGVIPGVDEFDPMFFHISPKDAEEMEPKQRIFLEEAYKALENAGIGEEQLSKNKVGVFVGAEDGDYSTRLDANVAVTSNHNAVLSARLAYFLNLTGPNFTINTACSSALVALHEACLSLNQDECDVAVVAGANIITTSDRLRAMKNANMLSPSGKCRAFDKEADGMVPAEAVAVVVLKKSDFAKEDGNPILATIIGSGINYDGKTNGITAPSGKSQTELLKDVYRKSHINPEEISYIVTHGTGTKLGDPIEINALADAFHAYTEKTGFCALTSTKSNIGHAMAASGIASLISLVKAMQEKMIPANINCEKVNDYIHWNDSPFYINQENKEWNDTNQKPRIGCVSAFGVSGTNAHVVVESYAQPLSVEENKNSRASYLLMLSAKSNQALSQKVTDLSDMLEKHGETVDMNSLSYTLFKGRFHYNHRLAITCSSASHACELLNKAAKEEECQEITRGIISRDFKEKTVLKILMKNMLKEHDALLYNRKSYQELLLLFAQMYCDGYNEGFDKIWEGMEHSMIPVPNYPFSRERYWVSHELHSVFGQKKMTIGKAELNKTVLVYSQWKKKELMFTDGVPVGADYVMVLAGIHPKDIGFDNLQEREGPDKVICLESKSGDYCGYAEELFLEVKEILKAREYSKVFLQVVYSDLDTNCCMAGLNGLLKSAVRENPKLITQLVRLENQENTHLAEEILLERQFQSDKSICFRGKQRYAEVYSEQTAEVSLDCIPWIENGTYLITGGTGGLGLIFAQEILDKVKSCNLILTGRRDFEQIEKRLNGLQISQSQNVEYVAMDVEDKEDTIQLIQDLTESYGSINGIIHTAGIILDSYIIRKETQTFRTVLGPKVRGVQNLDEATKEIQLDFMVFFASTAGILGNAGQSDYAAANAYMDAYARWRNIQVEKKKRFGHTLSIDWSFWKDGGMSMPDENVLLLRERTGIVPLETKVGIHAFYAGLNSGRNQIGVFSGDVERIMKETIEISTSKQISV